MVFQMFIAIAIISMGIPVYGVETRGETYWKMNFGSAISMPKVVKDSLLGPGVGSKDDGVKSAKLYAQKLFKAPGGKASNGNYAYAPNIGFEYIFLFEKVLIHPGSKMKQLSLTGIQKAKFISSEISNSISFSSNDLQEILQFFAVNPESTNAKIIEEAITLCEYKPIKGEQKYCSTSLEGMVNHVKSCLGDQVTMFTTQVEKETSEYVIEGAKKIENKKNLVCHKMKYPYAVFYCHTLSKTDVYDVSLIDGTGKNVKAVAVCHKDTSPWNPKHMAFQLLKVKPGSVPICHFLSADAVIWVTK